MGSFGILVILGYRSSRQQARTQQIQFPPPVHLPLHTFQPVDASLRSPVAPLQRQSRSHRRFVGPHPSGYADQRCQTTLCSLLQPSNRWLEQAAKSGLASLVSVATGMRADKAAVRAGLTLEWSNGRTEGSVNRLKSVKRQMYGRGKLDLLRSRLLAA